MTTHHLIPILGKRIRITTLDDCGNPPDPSDEDAFIATDGFIRVALSAETDTGAEIIVKKADGSLCVNEKLADSFKRFGVEIQFCGVNPSAASFVSNAEPYEDYAGDIAGFTVGEGPINKRFALELWTGLSGQACAPGVEEASGYILLPFITAGVIGTIEITGESAVDFTMTGAATKGGNNWGVGPYNVVADGVTASALPTPLDPLDHLLMIDTALAPPPSSLEPQPMPAAP